MKSLLKSFLGICFLAILPAALCSAATYTWNGSDSSDWFDALNWTPTGIPGTNDNVIVTNGSIDLSSPVVIGGEFDWSGGALNDSSLTIATNGVLNIQGSVTISNELDNFGTVNWKAGAIQVSSAPYDDTTVYNEPGALWTIQCDQTMNEAVPESEFAAFDNEGQLSKIAGTNSTDMTLYVQNRGQISAQIGTLNLSTNGGFLGGTYRAASNAAIYLSGYWHANGPVNFEGPGTMQITNGILDGSFSGTINMAGGQIEAFAGDSLTVLTNGVLNIQGPLLISEELDNYGTVNWEAGAIQVFPSPYDEANIYNEPGALWTIQCDQPMNANESRAGFPVFDNEGQLSKTAGTNSTDMTLYVWNTGQVSAQIGTLNLSTNGGHLSGTFQAASNAALYLSGNWGANGEPVNFEGPGVVQITNGILDGSFSGTINLANEQIGLFTEDLLTVQSNSVLNIQGPLSILLNSEVDNYGTINWEAGSITLNGIFINEPGALWAIQCDQPFTGPQYESIFENDGQIIKTGGTNSTDIAISFWNTGGMTAETGTINLTNGGSLSGNFQAASNAAIFLTGDWGAEGSVNFEGPGKVQITNGILDGGFSGTINLASGQIGAFTGDSFNILTNGVLNTQGPVCIIGELDNYGTVNWKASDIALNAILINEPGALWSIQCDQTVGSGEHGFFQNRGTLVKTGGTNTTEFQSYFNNFDSNSYVNVENGSMEFDQGDFEGTLTTTTNAYASLSGTASEFGTLSSSLNLSGNFNVSYLENQGIVNLNPGNVQLSQVVNDAGATWNFNGDFTIPACYECLFLNEGTTVKTSGTNALNFMPAFQNGANGTLQVLSGSFATTNNTTGIILQGTYQAASNASIQLDSFFQIYQPVHFKGPGTVQASGSIFGTLVGNVNWAGGIIGPYDFSVATNGVFNIQGSTTVVDTLWNSGVVNWQSGTLTAQAGSIQNLLTGRWNIQSDNAFVANGGQNTIYNSGSISKWGTTGTNLIAPQFYNTGKLSLESGALNFSNAPNLVGGTVCLGINSLTNFGKIIVPGSLPIAGGLNVHLNGGYSPSPSNSFALIQYGSATSTFNPVNLPRHIAWQTNYTPSEFILTALGHEATLIPLTLASGAPGQPPTFAFQFNGDPNQNYSVLATTNLALPLPAWTNLGSPSMLSNGLYQFSDPQSTNLPARFYILQSP